MIKIGGLETAQQPEATVDGEYVIILVVIILNNIHYDDNDHHNH